MGASEEAYGEGHEATFAAMPEPTRPRPQLSEGENMGYGPFALKQTNEGFPSHMSDERDT